MRWTEFLATMFGVIASASACLASTDASEAEGKETEKGFVRLVRDTGGEPRALQTAIVRFQPREPSLGETIDLVGAIHVADKSYYDELNRRFRTYDAVLYELVAPEDANVPAPGQRSGSAVGGLQVGMKSMLDLQFQLDCINYRARNMVHADMTPEEFRDTMKSRNESFLGMFFRIMGRAMAEQSEDPTGASDWKILAAMFAPDRAHQMKRVMAEEFADMEKQISVFDGPEGSTIVTERNKKALEVLRREREAGKRRLAIFYGAAHLPDLTRRLEEEFGMQRVETTWLDAWSLARKEKP